MANVYVRSGAAGAGTGADWANAYTTLALAIAKPIAAGDVLWVSEDHNESTVGSVTLTLPGTAASPNFIYCANHSGTVPPVSADLRATGAVTVTGNNTLTINGSFYCEGLIFTSGNGAGADDLSCGAANSAHTQKYKNCTFAIAGSSTARIRIGPSNINAATYVEWSNCIASFANVANGIYVESAGFVWKNTPLALAGAAVPTTLFSNGQGALAAFIVLEGVDLSAAGSGKTIMGAVTAAQKVILKDCKLGASVTVAASPTSHGSAETMIARSDSGATNYRAEKYSYTGTETTETTIIRAGGATDGATPQSRKLSTTANSRWVLPFEALPIPIWCPVAGAPVTVTLQATSNLAAGAFPNTDDIWLEAEYLGSSLTPQGSFATNTKADNLAAGAAYTSSGVSWAGSPAGGAFAMSVTFTPQQAGPVTLYVKAAKASTIFYVDPRPEGIGHVQRTYAMGAPFPAMVNEALLSGGAALGRGLH